jgi:hypothetical protein
LSFWDVTVQEIWDREGTGNTVPPVPKRKNFQVLWLNSRLLFDTGKKFSFTVSIFHFSWKYAG